MKLQSLTLAPFGPFEDKTLHFSTGQLTLVYGPNEAGKSSALRALGDFFYGVPSRSIDNFRFDYRRLRLRGEIVLPDGTQVQLERQKKAKDDLKYGDGAVVPEQQWAAWLSHTPRGLFESLFGINHDALREGSEAILQEDGEIGRILFAAASGSRHLATTREQLASEAEAVFKPRGKNQQLNAALGDWKKANDELKSVQLAASEFESRRQVLSDAREALEQARTRLGETKARHAQLQAMARLKPLLARYDEIAGVLSGLESVQPLSAGFADRYHAVQETLAATRSHISQWQADLQRAREQLPDGQAEAALLAANDSIVALYESIAGHRIAEADLAELLPELETRQQEFEAVSATLKGQSAQWQDALDARSRFETLTEDVIEQSVQCRQLVQQAEKLEADRARLAPLPSDEIQADPAALEMVLQRVLPAQHISDEIDSLYTEVGVLERQLALSTAGLQGWQGSTDELLSRAFPSTVWLEEFSSTLQEVKSRVQADLQRVEEYQSRKQAASSKYQLLKAQGKTQPPSELATLRGDRDEAWQAIRLGIEGEAKMPRIAGLNAFESKVGKADDLADALRENADWVSQLALAEEEADKLTEQLDAAMATLTATSEEAAQHQSGWMRVWSEAGVQAGSVSEMRAWLSTLAEIRQSALKLEEKRAQLNHLSEKRSQLTAMLGDALSRYTVSPEADDFDSLLICTRETVQQTRKNLESRSKLQEQHDTLSRQQAALGKEQTQAEQRLVAARQAWVDAAPEGAPAEAGDVAAWLQRIEKAMSLNETLQGLKRRRDTLQLRIARFQNEAQALGKFLPASAVELAQTEQVALVYRRLREEQERESERRRQTVLCGELEQKIQQAEARLSEQGSVLATMLKEAACNEVAELPGAIRAASEKQAQTDLLREVQSQINTHAPGESLDALRASVAELDLHAINTEIPQLALQLSEELEPAYEEAVRVETGAKRELDALRGDDAAAVLAGDVSAKRARARDLATRYLRLKLAATLLANETERFRQQHQGPLLEKASALFAQLTEGAFTELDVDTDGKQVLLAARREGSEELLRVDGMSSGTRDQLYLALRLASLERYVEDNGPVPFIVDDILIEFDDARTRAALSSLKTFAAHTQVIVFTHHQHVVELATAMGDIAIERL